MSSFHFPSTGRRSFLANASRFLTLGAVLQSRLLRAKEVELPMPCGQIGSAHPHAAGKMEAMRNLPELWRWVEAGGHLVVQYNRAAMNRLAPEAPAPPEGKPSPYVPYPATVSAERISDETTAMRVLVPAHPLFTTPNRIGDADWSGWVQERGTYFPSSWDAAHYKPILAMNDTGEQPLQGSLLVAKHGQGYYVYTGLTFFRQLPAGVPGGYRLFANLLALGKE